MSAASRFPVSIVTHSPIGALVPRLSNGDLVLESDAIDGLNLAFGAEIDAQIVLDIDESEIVAGVELLVPREHWTIRRERFRPPDRIDAGVLAIPSASHDGDNFDGVNVEIWSDPGASQCHVQLEPIDSTTKWISLSPDCYALVNGQFLAALVARLRGLNSGEVSTEAP